MLTRPMLRTVVATVALALGSAEAFAQAPAATPETSPPAPGISAVSAPKGADDMTGSIGFGVGVIPNAQLAGTNGEVAVKYWWSDKIAFVPALIFTLTKPTGMDTAWVFNPEAVALYVPFQSTSTRLLVGGGLGISLSKLMPMLQPDTTFEIYLPIQAGVEHFFTRWFSLGIAARTRLFDYAKTGGVSTTSFAIDSTSLLGSLFFYTD
jgi:hypothetical protein